MIPTRKRSRRFPLSREEKRRRRIATLPRLPPLFLAKSEEANEAIKGDIISRVSAQKNLSLCLHFLFSNYFILVTDTNTTLRKKRMAKRPRKGGSAAGGPGGPAMRTTNTDSSEYVRKRQAECRGLLEALNFQFYSHVCEQHKNNPRKSWAEGCQDYVKHMKKLMVRS